MQVILLETDWQRTWFLTDRKVISQQNAQAVTLVPTGRVAREFLFKIYTYDKPADQTLGQWLGKCLENEPTQIGSGCLGCAG